MSVFPGGLPESILARFRTLSLERIGRVESIWNALLQGAGGEEAVREMSRDLHTLKGDAKVVGFDDVHVLAHKLEELVALAGQFEYRVSEDFELVVTMATQFASMLLRKKTTGNGGIDLDGFVRQVDDVLRESLVIRKARSTPARAAFVPADPATDRLSAETRGRLAASASEAFLEYLAARHPGSRTRLRRIWQTLRHELSRMGATELAPLLERQRHAGEALAAELGKKVELVNEANEVRLEPRVAEAVDVAVLHLVRNAIDHGIERPEVRAAAGKPRAGRIRMRGEETAGNLLVSVEDDGAGLDVEAVRAAAVERGVLAEGRAVTAEVLAELVFQPGFTTRATVSDVSGRGVGLDAVKAGLTKVGGVVRLATRPGHGTTITLVVPAPVRQLRVFQFLAPGGALNLAVSARWTPTVVSSTAYAIDPLEAMQLVIGSRQTLAGTPPPRQLAMRLRWGFLEVPIRIGSEPVLATAERVCPTADDYPLEVVVIDGVEALLLRPEHVAERAARR